VAHAAGVRTPRLCVFDDSRSILEVPFTIYERVQGETLGLLEEPADLPATWRALGRDVALLHQRVQFCEDPAGFLDRPRRDDPRDDLSALASDGALAAPHARWLSRWLDQLAPAVLAPVTPRFLHDDLQATNVMVTRGSHDYLAMIDWGDAGWGDPSLDLRSMPLLAVPFALSGYRQVQPFENDETVEARVLWDQIAHALHQLRHPRPGRSRAGYVWELLRFAIEQGQSRCADWSRFAPFLPKF
jgi:aminoglycoside phosphotransferase (APT) family kinase protein